MHDSAAYTVRFGDHLGAARVSSGYAFDAATCALHAAAAELPNQPVLIVTQTANERSLKLATRLGFRPVSTFEAFGAQQTLATAALHAFAGARRE
ncbi:hypothetical protein NBRGN_065_00540 [Nocardia brasiliensis NBRC 14402]|uniref:GNAT family N-acetyltransferase n=1 Tax=Nocardia brasiliensis TaxID=37326 RepID=UPI00045D0D51|nr:GNAT family N-acetyltransferase [Nocardia brasiliensis]GAJ83658.1 hypothetical protein NBRGN_065_00540 [Nocardia brasiliensis NBRC 14402]